MSKLRECSFGQLQRMPSHQSSSPPNRKFNQSSAPHENQSTPLSSSPPPLFQSSQSLFSSSSLRPSSISPLSLPPSALSSTICPTPRPSSPQPLSPQPLNSAHLRGHGPSSQASFEHPPPGTADKDTSKSPSISKQRNTTSKVSISTENTAISKRTQPKQRNTTSKASLSTSTTTISKRSYSKPKQRNSTSKTQPCSPQNKQHTQTNTHTQHPNAQIPHCSNVQQKTLPRSNQRTAHSTQSSHQKENPPNRPIPNSTRNPTKRTLQPQVGTRPPNNGTNVNEYPGVHQHNSSNIQRITHTNSLKILHWNCEGANKKINTILDSIKNDDIDIALLQDTRIKEHPDNKDIFKLDGYYTYYTVKKV